jgi:hypothetical protein
MFQKGCECREREVEEWKQNWDEVFVDDVKRGERERERRVREVRKEKEGKCSEMFGDRKG